MVYVGKNVYKCTLYLCNVSKFKKCRKKGCNFQINIDYIKNIDKTNRFITLEGTKTAVEMGGTFIKKVVGVLGL